MCKKFNIEYFRLAKFYSYIYIFRTTKTTSSPSIPSWLTHPKPKKNTASVKEFIAAVSNETRRRDAEVVLKLMQRVTGKPAKMWGPSIIGFDQYHYKYDSGHEGDICMIGFSPRSQALTLHTLTGFAGQDDLLAKLGKHKRGKGCLYVNRLADIDMGLLEQLAVASYSHMKQQYS